MSFRGNRISRWLAAAGVAVVAAALIAPAAAPRPRTAAASVEKWYGGGSGGLTQTKHRDTGGDPKTRIESDDSQAYKGEITFKFTIDASGSITGSGKGKYYQAEWHLSGTNGDKGPISCDPTITAKPFTVDVSGERKNGVITLSLRLPDAEESNVDTPCPTDDFVAHGGTSHRLDDSLEYSGGRSTKFTIHPSGRPDDYSATLSPPDEDRSGGDFTSWTVSHFWGITIGPDARFSKEDKDRLAKSSQELGIPAGALTAITAKYPSLPAALGSAAYWILGCINGRLALDPPDPHFRKIARPRPPKFPQLKAEGGLTPAAAAALNALNKNQARMIAFGRGVVTSINRAQGAKKARNKRWDRRQMRAARKYARQFATSIRANGRLRAQARTAVAGTSLGTATITAADVRALQDDVKAHGLPAWLVTNLTALGADPSYRNQVRTSLLVLNPTEVATHANIPDLLDNATLTAAYQAAVKALLDFAG